MYTPAQRKTALERNPLRCPCQVMISAPPYRTKTLGLKKPVGTLHQAAHTLDCPHSELAFTAFRLTTSAKRRAKKIAVECYRRRMGHTKRK